MNQFYKNIPWDLIAKVISGEADATAIQSLEAWALETPDNKALLLEIEELWGNSSAYQVALSESKKLDVDAAWGKVHTAIELTGATTQMKNSKGFMLRYSSRIAAAAAILVLLTLSAYWAIPYLNNTPPNTSDSIDQKWLAVNNLLNEPKTVQMPDGSSIVLNSGTSLRYPERFEPRLIELSGEAFFEVTPDPQRPFEVRFGKDASLKVLGTSFNIRAYEGEEKVAVAVTTGKVAFKTPNQAEMQLIAGDAVTYNTSNAKVQKAPNLNATAWKTQILYFENTELQEILTVLESHFHTKFEIANPDILNCRFKGIFEKESLEDILNSISFSLELDIEIKNKVYYIDGLGCDVN